MNFEVVITRRSTMMLTPHCRLDTTTPSTPTASLLLKHLAGLLPAISAFSVSSPSQGYNCLGWKEICSLPLRGV